jgi:hypothetical protein
LRQYSSQEWRPSIQTILYYHYQRDIAFRWKNILA